MTRNLFITRHMYIPSHNPHGSALLPILLKTTHTHTPTSLIPVIIMFLLILRHPRIPLLFLSSNKRLESMLLASSEVYRSDLTLGYGFGDEDIFDT